MRTYPVALLWAALAVLLSGCATALGPMSDESVRDTRRIAVVSDLGSRAYSVSLGTVAFGNRMTGREVPGWGVDAQVQTLATKALAAGGYERVEAVRLGSPGDKLSLFERRNQAIAEAERRGFDTVVFIYQGSLAHLPFFVPGYGVFQHVGHEDKVIERCHYAAYSISVNRVATKTQIGWDRAYRFPCTKRDEPGLTVKARMDDYSPQELDSMKAGVVSEIETSLLPALQRLKLVR